VNKVDLFVDRCLWFNGLNNSRCRAGIVYTTVRELAAKGPRYPCIHEDRARTICPKLRMPTRAQAEARAKGIAPETVLSASAIVTPIPTAKSGTRQLSLEDLYV
jgi:hypothetical protein